MIAAIDITGPQRKLLLAILRRFIPGVVVWAYGSRVKGTARPNSDLDLVAFTTPAQRRVVSELKDALAESDLPFLVDLHKWDEVPEKFHDIIRKEYLVVQEAEVQGRWPVLPLGELTENYDGRRVPVREIDLKPGPYPYYGASGIVDRVDSYLFDGEYLLIGEDGENLRTRQTPIAFMATGKFWVNNHAHIVRGNHRADTRFLGYVLSQSDIGGYLTDSTMPKLTQGNLNRLPVIAPPLAEQKAIASVLGALDDKIELNRRMNATLEAMARALFQSWFVDFDPVRRNLDRATQTSKDRKPSAAKLPTPRKKPAENFQSEQLDALFPEHFEHGEDGLIPVGWCRAAIEDLCDINAWTLGKNDDMEILEYLEISEVSRGNIAAIATYARGEVPSRARRRLRHGDTVLSTVRPDRGSYFLALSPPENRVASTGFAVLTPTKAPWSFIHAAMTLPEVSEHLGQMADGGAYPAVRPEVIGAMKVAMPNEPKILEAFHRTCAPLFEQAEANRTHSRTLATLRDTLLPKLLSGELSVEKIHTSSQTN